MKQTFEFFGQAIKEAERLKKPYIGGTANVQNKYFLVSATTEDPFTSVYEVQPFDYQVRDAITASGGRVLEIV